MAPLHDIYIWGNIFGEVVTHLHQRQRPSNWPNIPPPYRIRMNATFGTDYRYGVFNWDSSPTIQVNFNVWEDGSMEINTWDMWPQW